VAVGALALLVHAHDHGDVRQIATETLQAWQAVCALGTIMVAQYFLPLAVMSATYSSIAYVVWLKRQVPGEAVGPRDHKIAASKKKVWRPI